MTKKAYCFGHISTGKLIRINSSYPQANSYAEIIEELDNFSGEALSTSIVLKRLGIQPTLEGNWIGDNEAGRKTIDFINAQDFITPSLKIEPDYIGANEIVISDENSRTVFGRYIDLLFTKQQWELPNLDSIRACGVATCDPGFVNVAQSLAFFCNEYKIPFVGIDTPFDSWYAHKSSVLIISEEFLIRHYSGKNYNELFSQYIQQTNALVIFTFGANPIWYGRDSKQELHPFSVRVKDTAGAGDSFRAGIMYGILHNMNDYDMIRFASAVAALVIQTAPGVVNFSGLKAVNDLLNLDNVIT